MRRLLGSLFIIALGIAVMMIPGTLINGGELVRKTSEVKVDIDPGSSTDTGDDTHNVYIEPHESADLTPITSEAENKPTKVASCTDAAAMEHRLREACRSLSQMHSDMEKTMNEVYRSWQRRRSVNKKVMLQSGYKAVASLYQLFDVYISKDRINCAECWLDTSTEACTPSFDGFRSTCDVVLELHKRGRVVIDVFEGSVYLKAKYRHGVDVIRNLYNAQTNLKKLHVFLDCVWCHNKPM